jgi:hypothetical protein
MMTQSKCRRQQWTKQRFMQGSVNRYGPLLDGSHGGRPPSYITCRRAMHEQASYICDRKVIGARMLSRGPTTGSARAWYKPRLCSVLTWSRGLMQADADYVRLQPVQVPFIVLAIDNINCQSSGVIAESLEQLTTYCIWQCVRKIDSQPVCGYSLVYSQLTRMGHGKPRHQTGEAHGMIFKCLAAPVPLGSLEVRSNDECKLTASVG